jgi:hypothetical protein
MGKGPIIKGVLSGLTPAEKIYLATHPHHISIIRENADKALAEAQRLFPGPSLHNGDGDSFRHCFWSALLARDIGKNNALQFTTAHEGYSANPSGERAMDLHNNGVGVGIGGANTGASDGAISLLCQNALATGKLKTAPPSPGAPY